MPDQYYDFTQMAQKLQEDFNRVEAMQGVEQFTCTTTGTTHAITGGASGYENTVFKFTADADFNKSYTTTVNGTAVQCLLPNNDEVQNNFFRSGASVLCMLDATNNKLYFVGGGGGAGGNYFFNRGVTTWASDSTYADYPYKGTINITGVTDADGVEVTFSNADATSGNYSPICATFNGGVYIWSKTQDANIVIPTICIYGRSNEDLSGEFPYLSLEGGTVRGDVTVEGDITASNLNSLLNVPAVTISDYVSIASGFTVNILSGNLITPHLLYVCYDISGTLNDGETIIGSCTSRVKAISYGASRCTTNSNGTRPATTVWIPSGAIRLHSTGAGRASAGTAFLIVDV